MQNEPGPFQTVPKGWALVIGIAAAPGALLCWKAELKASGAIDFKVYRKGLLILLLKAPITQSN